MPEVDADAQPFTGSEDCTTALHQLLGSARRRVRITSRHLAHAVYHNPLTVQALSDFARRSRYSQVEILVADTSAMRQRPHRLLPLIQRLASYIQLRRLRDDNELTAPEYVLGDDRQLLLVTDTELWQGIYHPCNRPQACKLHDEFSRAWDYGQVDPNLRQLQL